MAGRMSNRDRIAHAALEAEAARKDREKAATERKAAPAKRARAPKATKPAGRTRIVWALCDPTGATVDTYPYADEAKARAEAERLTAEKGRPHFIKRAEVPFA